MSAIKSIIVFLFISITLNSISQYSISGLVQDQNGESLIGTTVLIKELSKGTSSDIKGYYNMELSRPRVNQETYIYSVNKSV